MCAHLSAERLCYGCTATKHEAAAMRWSEEALNMSITCMMRTKWLLEPFKGQTLLLIQQTCGIFILLNTNHNPRDPPSRNFSICLSACTVGLLLHGTSHRSLSGSRAHFGQHHHTCSAFPHPGHVLQLAILMRFARDLRCLRGCVRQVSGL